METCSLGCTIALPGYQNIKVEVAAEGYTITKEYLRSVLLSMCKEKVTTDAISAWWKMVFGKNIFDDYPNTPPVARPLAFTPNLEINPESKQEKKHSWQDLPIAHNYNSDSGSMADLETQHFFEDIYDGEL